VKILIQKALGYAAASAIALCVCVAILWILVHYFSSPHLVVATAMPFGVRRQLLFVQRRPA
jgi:hypothetical protein